MELSRQRLRPSLEETAHQPCPRCSGIGFIRGIESTALHILRIIQEEAMKENTAAVHIQVPVDVSTYLLNEKRPDIHALEARLKVNIVLIPNVHLETPHYKIERLRHDDLNQEGVLPPSYNLVEAPTEEPPYAAPQEARAPRQQAVVQGVTPERPAPIAPPKPLVEPVSAAGPVRTSAIPEQPGLIDRIMGWFRRTPPAPEAAVVRAAPVRPQPQERRERGERFERRDRGPDRRPFRGDGQDRGRGERPPRGERMQPQGRAQGADRQGRGEQQGPRDQRGPRREERPRHAERPPQQDSRMLQGGGPGQGGQPRLAEGQQQDGERHRGRRNRRDRGERREGQPRSERVSGVPPERIMTAPPAAAPVSRPAPAAPTVGLEPVAEHRAPAPVPEIESRQEPRGMPPAPPPQDLDTALRESGLVMIETDRGKVREAEPVTEALPPRPRRERRPPPPGANEPLEQVETRTGEAAAPPSA
jgi:ribonuclease E